MSNDLVVRGRAVLPDGTRRVDIGVRDGRITAISDTPLTAPTVVALTPDEVLLPGLVDTHVHVNDPGRTQWEGFATATRAAAAGGVTTIVDMPLNSIPPTVDPAALATKRAVAAGQVAVDVGFWGGAVPGNLGRLRALHDDGVLGFKCFLAPSGVDEFGHLDPDGLLAAMTEVASFGGLLLVHAEDPGVLDAHAHTPPGRDHAAFVASRPDDAETVAIRRVVDGVRRTGARAHVLHLSSAAALPLLADARDEGLPVTVETCPHYLTLTEPVPDGATQFKCCPPIRGAANADALWQGLRDGVVDAVVSDHSPSTRELKLAGGGDFGVAWGGIAGLQVSLPAVWTEARRRGVALDDVVRWMAHTPSRIAGLAKGQIHVGADADLVAFAPDEPWTVDADALEHRNKVTAYDGARLHGVVRRTWLRGVVVHPRPDAGPHGRLLTRGTHT
ncbi:allantoinase AllB [Cellulomonas sp. ATA003]|uniref:allantoinase AllB n=1 Tax=Cellulomonas sp. ATA003 TaxID=3073064 RepID=UPI002873621B|nr:allantoinase AllB [Cellulomonas sp. ATA003]WNB86543.1 allantoinase AllB [Cellulomonas sp. ATA003]